MEASINQEPTLAVYDDFRVVAISTHQYGLVVNLLLGEARLAIDNL